MFVFCYTLCLFHLCIHCPYIYKKKNPKISYFSEILEMNVYMCISCSSRVSERMHALCCDSCSCWQHRVCKNGKNLLFLPSISISLFLSLTSVSVCLYLSLYRSPPIPSPFISPLFNVHIISNQQKDK